MWTPTDASDDDLIAAAREGDRDAYAELFQRYRGPALRFAATLTTDHARAADLVSEAFIKILAHLDRGGGPTGRFQPYLFSTVRNLHVDRHRREAREILVEENVDSPSDQIDEFERRAEASTLLAAFQQLPDHWRNVLWRTEVLGQSLQEVAESLDSNANAAGVTAFRAREALREAYLAQHLSTPRTPACREVGGLVPRFVRGKLGARRAERLTSHLRTCGYCTEGVREIQMVNNNLSALLVPAFVASNLPPLTHQALGAVVAPSSKALAVVATAIAGGAVVGSALIWAPGSAERAVPDAGPATITTATSSPTPPAQLKEPTPAPVAPAPPAPTPTPTPSATLPTPTRLEPSPAPPAVSEPPPPEPRPVRMAAPMVAVVDSAAGRIARVSTRIDPGDGGNATVFLTARGVGSARDISTGWSCTTSHPSTDELLLQCEADTAASPSFAVSLGINEGVTQMTGEIGLLDRSQVFGFAAGP